MFQIVSESLFSDRFQCHLCTGHLNILKAVQWRVTNMVKQLEESMEQEEQLMKQHFTRAV